MEPIEAAFFWLDSKKTFYLFISKAQKDSIWIVQKMSFIAL